MKKVLSLLLALACVTAAAAPACAYASEYEEAPAEEEKEYDSEYTQPPHELSYIYVYSMPYITTYDVGNSLYTEGLAIALGYADGEETVEWSGFSCYPNTLEHPGTQWIEVEYAGLYTGFYVSVMDNSQISGLEIYQLPDKLNYEPGDTLDMTGLKIRVLYTDGRSFVTSSRFTCTPATMKTEGIQTIRVDFEGSCVTFDVSVGAPEKILGISLASPPDKTEYKPGDSPDLSGLRITVSRANGEETIDAANNSCIRVSPEHFDKAGRQIVTVTYQDGGEFSCEFPVQVTAAETPEPAAETPEKETVEKTVSGVWIIPALIAAVLVACAFYVLHKNKDAPAGRSIQERLALRRENRNKADKQENKERTGEDHHEV